VIASSAADAVPLLVDRLDPRARILCVAVILVATFFVTATAGVVLATVAVALLAPVLRRNRGRHPLVAASALGFVLAFSVNLLFTPSTGAWVSLPAGVAVGPASLEAGLRLGLRVANLTLWGGVLATSTSAPLLADAGSALLTPAARLAGRRVHRGLFQLQLAMRLVPALTRESRRVVVAQRARGLRLDGGWRRRVRALVPLFVPILAFTLLRAQRTGLVLAARGVDPDAPRRYLTRHTWRMVDGVAVAGVLVGVVGLLRLP